MGHRGSCDSLIHEIYPNPKNRLIVRLSCSCPLSSSILVIIFLFPHQKRLKSSNFQKIPSFQGSFLTPVTFRLARLSQVSNFHIFLHGRSYHVNASSTISIKKHRFSEEIGKLSLETGGNSMATVTLSPILRQKGKKTHIDRCSFQTQYDPALCW